VAKRSDPAVRAKAREMFEREALLLYKLEHPNIAKVIDYFVEEGRDYLVLEYVAGCSLRQYVQANGARDQVQTTKLASQICDILLYLHGQDPPIVHRDITPDNIVIKEDGEICLIDFGAANEFVGTMTGTVVGKQCYIAPEQFRGKATPASDIYALGCTMYYLITGKDPEPLSTSHPKDDGADVSARFDRLIQLCTACNTAERIESAEKLKAELLTDSGDVIDLAKFRARRMQQK
jgi:serine/threonine-protein kinase